ncbi:unnamed protein product [Gongylonema pulchrum]|uniref:Uncharacterized protein n=1 Tax=Gongylonema pulchrum TaxID=637853 RepID=A0A3P6PLL8_9BILA|nr:unnamed protein product [Gongylonema pulchrum]
MQGNAIGVGAGRRLAVVLEHHPELKRSLCDAMIRSGTALVELDLSDNAFGPVVAEGIEKFLKSPSAYSLEVLKLNNNELGAGGKTIAKTLIQCHRNATKDGRTFRLKKFIAGQNRLKNRGAIALARAFKDFF